MKKILSKVLFILFLLLNSFVVGKSIRFNYSINKVNWLEVSNQRFCKQVMFDFDKPFYFEREVDRKNNNLKLIFPGIAYKDFSAHEVISKLRKLKGVIKNVDIVTQLTPTPRLVLTISFYDSDFLIRWNKMEDPNRLILDIFSKKLLEKLKNKGAPLLYASNGNAFSGVQNKKMFDRNLINLNGVDKKKQKKV